MALSFTYGINTWTRSNVRRTEFIPVPSFHSFVKGKSLKKEPRGKAEAETMRGAAHYLIIHASLSLCFYITQYYLTRLVPLGWTLPHQLLIKNMVTELHTDNLMWRYCS